MLNTDRKLYLAVQREKRKKVERNENRKSHSTKTCLTETSLRTRNRISSTKIYRRAQI